MSKSSKRRAFHVSKQLLTAGTLAGGVALGAGCKPEPEVTSNPAPIAPPQTTEPEMELPKAVEPPINVNPGPMKAPITPPKATEPEMKLPPPEPLLVNPGPIEVPIDVPDDMGEPNPAQDMTKAAAADLGAEPETKILDRAPYQPNVNTQHIRHRPPASDRPQLKKP